MRLSVNLSKAAMQYVPAEATRVRTKLSATGALMLLPTARKSVAGLDALGEKAAKLTRDKRGTVTLAVNYEALEDGNFKLTPGKFGWLTLQRMGDDEVLSLSVARARMSKKSG